MKFIFTSLIAAIIFALATGDNEKVSYESLNYPGTFVTGYDNGKVAIAPYDTLHPLQFVQMASFTTVTGLADTGSSDTISLMSLNKANTYLVVTQLGRPALMAMSTGDENFYRMATFIVQKGLARKASEDNDCGRYVSFESYSMRGQYLRHLPNKRDIVLGMPDGTDQFMNDATFWERTSLTQF